MTVKMTISLPDDLAAFVRSHPNASAFVAEMMRKEQGREATWAAIEAVGVTEVPPEEYARIVQSHIETEARRKDPARRAQLDARLSELVRRPER